MRTVRTRVVALFVDRTSGRWVARDSDGGFWTVPATDTPWDDRQPFSPAEETDLERVPGHYRHMLGLPC